MENTEEKDLKPRGLAEEIDLRREVRHMQTEILAAIREGRIDEIRDLCEKYRHDYSLIDLSIPLYSIA